jgi:hypothetical protein
MTLTDPEMTEAGRYEFAPVKLPAEGRWDVMAKVTVGDDYRFYNMKADTRYTDAFEY